MASVWKSLASTLNNGVQILKIVSPYVMLAIAFSILNARLDLPPFSLFLVALTLTDSKLLLGLFDARTGIADNVAWVQS